MSTQLTQNRVWKKRPKFSTSKILMKSLKRRDIFKEFLNLGQPGSKLRPDFDKIERLITIPK